MTRSYDEEIDTSGLLCPLPLVKAKQKLKEMQKGKILRVITTDSSSVLDFKAYAASSGNQLLSLSNSNGKHVIFLLKKS